MRLAKVWNQYIDLDKILAIDSEPVVHYYDAPLPPEPVSFRVALALRAEPFTISRGLEAGELRLELLPPDQQKYDIYERHFAMINPAEWLPQYMLNEELIKRTLVYTHAQDTIKRLVAYWSGLSAEDASIRIL